MATSKTFDPLALGATPVTNPSTNDGIPPQWNNPENRWRWLDRNGMYEGGPVMGGGPGDYPGKPSAWTNEFQSKYRNQDGSTNYDAINKDYPAASTTSQDNFDPTALGATPVSITPQSEAKPAYGPFTSFARGVAKAAIVDPFKALVVRPAQQFGEAVGALGVNAFGSDAAKQKMQEYLSQDRPSPIAGINIEGVKTGAAGYKQVAGQGLEAATDIASLAMGGGVSSALTKPTTFLSGATQGAFQGIKSGALFGAGQGTAKALQEDKNAGQIATQGVTGGIVGGVTGGLVGGLAGGVTGSIRGAINRHQEILNGLAQDRQPSNIIEYSKVADETINPESGKIRLPQEGDVRGYKIDKVAKEALNQGIDPTDVQFMKNASDADKKAFREMWNTATAASQDKTFAGQPTEVVGKSLVKQAQYVDGVRKQVGAQLGEAAKAMVQTPLDVSPTLNKLVENLDSAGVTLGDEGQLVFDGSRYADQPAVQKALQKVYSTVAQNKGILTPAQIITARQRIFTNNNYAKAANEIVPGDFADSMINQVYDTLDDPLKEANKSYGDLAQKYAQSSQALRDFGNIIGKNFDLGEKLTDLRAGEIANRTLSNASANSLKVVSNLSDTAQSLGYQGQENVRTQALFANMLQDPNYNLFKPTQITSLRSRVAQGAVDAAKSFKGGLVSGVSNLAEKGLKAAAGVTTEGRRAAIEKLIGLTQGALKFK